MKSITLFYTTLTFILFANLTFTDDYTDDAAAATGGVVIGGIYRTGNDLKVRLA